MSDSNRVALRYAREASYKTSVPALPAQDVTGTSTLKNVRFTKDSLDAGKVTVTSEEIRSDRMVSALVEVGVKPSGGFDSEFLSQEYDDIIAAALMANEGGTQFATSSVIVAAAGTITYSANPNSTAVAAANPQFVLISGCTNPGNNGYKTILSITPTVITVALGQMSADETAGAASFSFNFVTAIDTPTVTVAGQVMTATAGTFSTAVQGARYVKIGSAATPGNNGIKKVVSCTGTVLTLAAGSLTGSDTGDAITVQCNYIRTGTTYLTHVFQKEFLDIPHFMAFTGMGVDTLDLKLEAAKIAQLSFTFMGYKGAESANSIANLIESSTAWTPTNAASNIGSVTKDGSAMLNPIKSIALKLNNNLRERPIISDLGSAAHGQGRSEITGQMEVYFANKELLREYLNHVAMAVEFPIVDLAGNTTNFYMPAIETTKGTPTATAVNTDVMQTITFQAFMDPTKLYQLQIDRLLA